MNNHIVSLLMYNYKKLHVGDYDGKTVQKLITSGYGVY